MAKRRDKIQIRLIFLLFFIIASLAGIAARLVVVQHVQADKLSEMAKGQRLREVVLHGERGTIYDRQGHELAINLEAYAIYATPYFVKKPKEAAVKIGATLQMKPSVIEEKLRQDAGFVYIARQVDAGLAEQVKALGLEGIEFLSERKRCYPNGSLAAHVLGFTGVDNQGLNGIEVQYEQTLHGKPGKLIVEGDPAGAPIPGGIYSRIPPTEGKDIYLTIDKDIQYKAEVEIKKLVDDYSAKGGSIVVIDPKNGEIYAMASYPTFNSNMYDKTEDIVIRNKPVTDTYEPGSTAKVITAIAGLETKTVGIDEIFSLPAEMQIDGQSFGEYDGKSKGDQDITGIISLSSNIGAIKIGQRVGKNDLCNYFEVLGLGSPTGIDFPGEAGGVFPSPDEWSSTSMATIPYGQGITATQLQMLNVFAIVANDGRKNEPHLVRDMDSNKEIDKGDTQDGDQVISQETATQTQKILINAVEEGTGKNARIHGYEVGGKTGTAQKVGDSGLYEKGKYIISFAGYVANQDPQLAIIVIIDEPQATGPQPLYAATLAAPVFKTISEFCIKHLKIPPGGRVLPEE